MFYHSLISDWNHGNAHFLRGVVTELLSRGHKVVVYEPADSWSRRNLLQAHGHEPIRQLLKLYPWLESRHYDLKDFDIDMALEGADLVIVHEWNEHDLVRRIGEVRRRSAGFRLLFHDTHHRSVTEPESMALYDLSDYDGVLAFGEVIKDIYLKRGWAARAWTWHEAADTKIFYPRHETDAGDLVWIGNWGDDERTLELNEFLLSPVKELGLKARMHGVRYPEDALCALDDAGIDYGGWLPNYAVPHVFAGYKMTVHVPRRPYVEALPGIPTIRVFEALACGIPLVSAPWEDAENLFEKGKDFLLARNGKEMTMHLKTLSSDKDMRRELAANGRAAILKKHTCEYRVNELMNIYSELTGGCGEHENEAWA